MNEPFTDKQWGAAPGKDVAQTLEAQLLHLPGYLGRRVLGRSLQETQYCLSDLIDGGDDCILRRPRLHHHAQPQLLAGNAGGRAQQGDHLGDQHRVEVWPVIHGGLHYEAHKSLLCWWRKCGVLGQEGGEGGEELHPSLVTHRHLLDAALNCCQGEHN